MSAILVLLVSACFVDQLSARGDVEEWRGRVETAMNDLAVSVEVGAPFKLNVDV